MNESLKWFKSSYSGQPSTDCVELAYANATVKVRDSKDAGGPHHTFEGQAWNAFIQAVKHEKLSR